jgi:hypothetical protein
MLESKTVFEKTSQSESLKICGNCRRARFCLEPKNLEFLKKMAEWHGIHLMRLWAKNGHIMAFGGQHVDPDKTRAAELIRETTTYCIAAGAKVLWPDTPCFLWRPQRPQPPRILNLFKQPWNTRSKSS